MSCTCCGGGVGPGGCNCPTQICRQGTVPITAVPILLCTVIVPPHSICCCPFPSTGGMINFPLFYQNPNGCGVAGFFNSGQCDHGCDCIGTPTNYWCGDNTDSFCAGLPTHSCGAPDAERGHEFWLCAARVTACFACGVPDFNLTFYLEGLGSFVPSLCGNIVLPTTCPALQAPNIIQTPTGVCFPPNPPYDLLSTGYDCGNLFLQYTVNPLQAGPSSCPPVTVVVQTPP